MRSNRKAQFAISLLIGVGCLALTARVSEAQDPRPRPEAGARPPQPQTSADFERIGREFQMLAWEVQNVIGRLAWDPALRRRLDERVAARDYRGVEELLRVAGIPERYEIHVLEGEGLSEIEVKTCFKWPQGDLLPEVNVSVKW